MRHAHVQTSWHREVCRRCKEYNGIAEKGKMGIWVCCLSDECVHRDDE